MNVEKDKIDFKKVIYPCGGCSMRSKYPLCKKSCIFSFNKSMHSK